MKKFLIIFVVLVFVLLVFRVFVNKSNNKEIEKEGQDNSGELERGIETGENDEGNGEYQGDDGSESELFDTSNDFGVWKTLFASGFESSSDGWTTSFIQTPPDREKATIGLSTSIVHSGSQSLVAHAPHEAQNIQKGTIEGGKAQMIKNDGLSFDIGDSVRIVGWYYLPSGVDYQSVFLMDIECTADVCDNASDREGLASGAGLQLFINNNVLKINSSKFGTAQSERVGGSGTTKIPLDKWFELKLEMELGKGLAGRTSVFINGVKDIDAVGTNIQPDTLPEVSFYDNVQVGVTVNRGINPVTIYVDDVEISGLFK